jgi:hypothetical protein
VTPRVSPTEQLRAEINERFARIERAAEVLA